MFGLALEGGGARGSYHIGVYKAMKELGIDIRGVVGTSIGAINGAMIVQGDYEKCYELWQDISYSKVFNIDEEEVDKFKQLKMGIEDLSFLGEKLKHIISERGLDISPLRDLLDNYIDEDKIRKSRMDFGIVTVNLTDVKPLRLFLKDIPKGQLKKYLIASASLPYFKTERVEGKLFLDGAFYDNLPFHMLLDKGYKDLIIVRTRAMGITRKMDLQGTNAIIISPSEDLGRTFIIESNKIRTNIQLGYYDGLRAFRSLKGDKYYIESMADEDYYLNYLLNIKEEEVREIEEKLRLQEIPYRRSLLENIVPKLCSLISIDRDCSYEDLLIYLLEKKAEKLNIEKFKVYTFEEILSEVEHKKIAEEKEELGTFGKIIEKVEAIPIFNKEEILLDVADIIFTSRN